MSKDDGALPCHGHDPELGGSESASSQSKEREAE